MSRKKKLPTNGNIHNSFLKYAVIITLTHAILLYGWQFIAISLFVLINTKNNSNSKRKINENNSFQIKSIFNV